MPDFAGIRSFSSVFINIGVGSVTLLSNDVSIVHERFLNPAGEGLMLPKKSADSRLSVDDFLAGIAAAAVVLPQAMAFGVALFTLLGATPTHRAV